MSRYHPATAIARRLALLLAGIAFALLTAGTLFALAGWIGSSIPRHGSWKPAPAGITILVGSNGVHTELVLPQVTEDKNWRAVFPPSDVAEGERPYTHVAISWGERQVFLETPTWWDLSPLTVLRILTSGGDGLLHVSHYVRPAPSVDYRPLTLTRSEYRRLVAAIEPSVPRGPRVRYPGYGGHDVFYAAPGRYSVVNTCNQWTSDRLADAGVRTGWWTPFAGGVTKWVPAPHSQ